jgi:hypothetical protein
VSFGGNHRSTLIKRKVRKEMGKAIRASALVLFLACSTSAGIMQNGSPAPEPPPPSTQSVQEPTTDGQEPTTDGQEATTEVEPQNLLVGIALNLLTLI